MNGVKVKRLKWVESSDKRTVSYYAETPIGVFSVYEEDAPTGGRKSWGTFSLGSPWKKTVTSDKTQKIGTSKRKCQAYFERLVLECLEADNE